MSTCKVDTYKTIWRAFAIDKYLNLNENKEDLKNKDKKADYQKNFNSFYRVRRCETWRENFYKIFVEALDDNEVVNKDKTSTAKEIFKKYLDKVREKCRVKDRNTNEYSKEQYEVSFVSKMLHTINPEMFPIFDSRVAESIEIKIITGEESFKMYEDLLDKYNNYLKEGGEVKNQLEVLREILQKAEPKEHTKLSNYKLLDIMFYT